jgi:DNA/RNA endonuclease YhcR with UshA esterase domain
MKTLSRTLAAFSLAIVVSGCAGSLRNPNIAAVRRDAGHYADRTVTIDGTVTNSWGVPLMPFNFYKVDDGTGEMTVLSRGTSRIPVKGSHVRVKGVVKDVAVFGGQPLGLHLEERSLDVKRH